MAHLRRMTPPTMNQRNFEALKALLAKAPSEGDWVKSREELQAEYLVSQGVLVPSALTDDEAYEIFWLGESLARGTPTENAAFKEADCREVRETLERIAKEESR